MTQALVDGEVAILADALVVGAVLVRIIAVPRVQEAHVVGIHLLWGINSPSAVACVPKSDGRA